MVNLKLFIYVIGQRSSFSVNIQRSDTVDDLKKAILRENSHRLKDIDAHELVFYKVEIPDGKDLGRLASQAPKEELEVPSSELSDIIPKKLRAKVVSILVKVPVNSE